MRIKKSNRRQLILKIMPYGVIWLVLGTVFLLSDSLATGGQSFIEGSIDTSWEVVLFALTFIFLVGLFVGLLEVRIIHKRFHSLVFWQAVLFKFLTYIVLFITVICLAYPIAASIELEVSPGHSVVWKKFRAFWGSYAFWSTALQLNFNLLVTILYSAVQDNLGYGVWANLVLGRYHRPKQEERMFLFLDMKSSTVLAEKLGDKRYFQLLQAYYDTFSSAISDHSGEVYQYVGDEIVITWVTEPGGDVLNGVGCYFAMKKALQKRTPYFSSKFGWVPDFKAGLHLGRVTTGVLGVLKREVVFTGDVLNTTARIQGLCSAVQVDFLVSPQIVQRMGGSHRYTVTSLGKHLLRGKENPIELYQIQEQI